VAREFVSLDRSAGIRKRPGIAKAMTPLRELHFPFKYRAKPCTARDPGWTRLTMMARFRLHFRFPE
jgi:hypothetical protein